MGYISSFSSYQPLLRTPWGCQVLSLTVSRGSETLGKRREKERNQSFTTLIPSRELNLYCLLFGSQCTGTKPPIATPNKPPLIRSSMLFSPNVFIFWRGKDQISSTDNHAPLYWQVCSPIPFVPNVNLALNND